MVEPSTAERSEWPHATVDYVAALEERIAELEAALNIVASGMRGDRVLADWEMSDIAAHAVGRVKRD